MNYLELEPARCRATVEDLLDAYTEDEDKKIIVAEMKLDGSGYLCHFGGGLDRTYFTSRVISKKTGKFTEKGLNVPHLHPIQKSQRLGYTVLHGEIVMPGMKSSETTAVMGGSPEHAESVQRERGFAHYVVYDLLFLNGQDLRRRSQQTRFGILHNLFVNPSFYAVVFPDLIEEVEYWTEPPYGMDWYGWFEHVVEVRKAEGIVLKDPLAFYGKGWAKLKKLRDMTCIITGFVPGKGKYTGMLGALKVSVLHEGKLIEVATASGMSDSERFILTKNMPGILQRLARRQYTMVDIQAQEFTGNRLRHPRIKKQLDSSVIRMDYNPMECTLAHLIEEFS